ncbi:MAG: molecular chaperone TorD family protein [Hyphomicrobiaceae bacterium]|nr:molecular chaperone TorD family protein [Hyphomicrobiaceae bacterium]
MRDRGLDEAIRAVGGVSELARRLGISQPSVSNWDRVPAERVPAVEAATGIERALLRPDLYGGPGVPMDAVDSARAAEYALLAKLLAQAPDADFLRRLSRLSGDATPLGRAHAELGAAAARTNREEVEREFFRLFIGVGRSELLPYGSYYLTGFLHERPLARLRADLQRIGIERAEGQCEPEDHAAVLCEIMSGLVAGAYGAPGTDRDIFEKHLAPWVPRFFAELEASKSVPFYARVGGLGRVFMDIESQAFALPP